MEIGYSKAEIEAERAEFPLGGGKHTFTVSVRMRGSGCDWSSDLTPVTVKACDLVSALQLAIERPFADWMTQEEEAADGIIRSSRWDQTKR